MIFWIGYLYTTGGLQGHTWELEWGPQGLEYATKRIGMNPVITQNFSTDPMGRVLSMTYNSASYNGELYFHYDVQGNTSLLTGSNGQAVASFRYDLHNGRIAASWNPNNLELVNLKNGRQGSVTLTSAIGYLPDWGIDLTVQPWRPIIARNDWGFINVRHDSTEPGDEDDKDDEKDCGHSAWGSWACKDWDEEEGISDRDKESLRERFEQELGRKVSDSEFNTAIALIERGITACCNLGDHYPIIPLGATLMIGTINGVLDFKMPCPWIAIG